MFDRHDRLPLQPCRILDSMQSGRAAAIEHGIQPVVALKTLRRAVLVLANGDDADARPAFDLDEADFDERLGVLGMRPPADEVEAAILGLDAFNHPTAGLLVSNRLL